MDFTHISPESIIAILACVGLWVRLEHRISLLETIVKFNSEEVQRLRDRHK